MQLASICDTAPVQPRRRLAENIICLFDEERTAVTNPSRWHGRYPRNVVRYYRFGRYLSPGKEATLFTFEFDHGKVVHLLYRATASDQKDLDLEGDRKNWFYVKVKSTGQQYFVHSKQLRRIR